MHFVQLTGFLSGKPTFVNMAVVTEVSPHGETGARLEFISVGANSYALVRESPADVLALLPQNAKHEALWPELGRERRKARVA